MRWIAIAALLGLVLSCATPSVETVEIGEHTDELIDVQPLTRYSAWASRFRLWLADVDLGSSGRRIDADVDCYRVRYWSRSADGEPIAASGLMAVPHAHPVRGIVSYQHGTTTRRDEVPSALNIDGELSARIFAGLGYAVLAPDYQGLGMSEGTHPYLVAEPVAADVTGLLRATQSLLPPDLPLFLVGFSQGGHATLAALRELETRQYPVVGAVAVAGPHHLREISLGHAISGQAPQDSLYLAYMTLGYAAAYHQPLESVLRADQIARVKMQLDGHHDAAQIIAELPSNPRELYNDDFLRAFDGGHPHWLLAALMANEVGDWRPRAPVLLLYGQRDRDVSPAEAHLAYQRMTAKGGNVQLQDLGDHDHDQSVLASVPVIISWINEKTVDDQNSIRGAK